MWRRNDDLADRLIASNAARPRPGMEEPDMAKVETSGWLRVSQAAIDSWGVKHPA